MQNLKNCPRCGKLTLAYLKRCRSCQAEVDKEFLICSQYLRENPDTTIYKLHEETGVSLEQIQEFIREGRFITRKLKYRCANCDNLIVQGKYCEDCQKKLREQFRESLKESQQSGRGKGYEFVQHRFENR